MVPVLSIGFGLPVKHAIATSMICIVATSAIGQLTFARRGLTHIRLGLSLEIASAAGAVLGSITAVLVDPRLLEFAFAAVLLYVAWRMNRRAGDMTPVRTGELEATYTDTFRGRDVTYGVSHPRLGFLLSAAAGNIAGLLGVGGGVFKVPVMNTVMNVPLRPAIATSNLMIGITAVAGGIVYYERGFVDPAYATPAVLGILVGARIGPGLALRLHTRVLSLAFQAVLALFALLMVAMAAGLVPWRGA